MIFFHRFYLLLIPACIVACDNDDSEDIKNETLSSIEISAPSSSIQIGEIVSLTFRGKNSAGDELSNIVVEWSTSNYEVAIVANGIVTGISTGKVLITVKSGNIRDDFEINVGNHLETPFVAVPVSFGADVSIGTRQKVVGFHSSLGFALPRDNVKIPVIKDRPYNLVLGLDKDENIVLLAFGNHEKFVLNSESTAEAITHLVVGFRESDSISFEQFSHAVKSVSSFENLKGLVQNSLNDGKSPLNYEAVNEAVTKVSEEVIKTFQKPDGGRKQQVELPQYFIDGTFRGENLWLEDSAIPTDVELINDTRLDWVVTSTDRTGEITRKTMPMTPFKFFEFIPGVNPPTRTFVSVIRNPSDHNTAEFTIMISQNQQTINKHALYLVESFVSWLLQWASIPTKELGCTSEIAKAILNDKLADLILKPDGQAALNYIRTICEESSFNFDLFRECGLFPVPNKKDINSKFIKALARSWNKLQLLVSTSSLGIFTGQFIRYWNFSKSISLCKIDNKINDCLEIHRVEILPSEQELNINDTQQLTAKAYDLSSSEVSVPEHLWEWTSDGQQILSLYQEGGKVYVKALKEGTSVVRLRELLTLKEAWATFQVENGLPILITYQATSVTKSSAKLGGNIIKVGSSIISSSGLCWNTQGTPTIVDTKNTDGTGKEYFNSTIRGLSPDTQYHVRAYATNSSGTAYGNEVSFTTAPDSCILTVNWGPPPSYQLVDFAVYCPVAQIEGLWETKEDVCDVYGYATDISYPVGAIVRMKKGTTATITVKWVTTNDPNYCNGSWATEQTSEVTRYVECE